MTDSYKKHEEEIKLKDKTVQNKQMQKAREKSGVKSELFVTHVRIILTFQKNRV